MAQRPDPRRRLERDPKNDHAALLGHLGFLGIKSPQKFAVPEHTQCRVLYDNLSPSDIEMVMRIARQGRYRKPGRNPPR